MQRIYDVDLKCPSVKNVTHLPYAGRYHAMISDVQTRLIEPLAPKEELCLIVNYKLIHTETGDFFDFVESYGIYNCNPRTSDFEAFLAQYGCDLTSDDDIVGIMVDVDIVNEYIGGFMHPVISYRRCGIDKAIQAYGDETQSIY